jgi:VIT1/CCC1 family predicted Fe2+/Mn2+ transporter
MNPTPSHEELLDLHTEEAIAHRLNATTHNYLGDFILGAVDGAVTTFAIVAGAAGAGLSSGVAVVLGVANVLADGFSMAAGNYLKARSDHQTVDHCRRIEAMHIERVPDGEREEVRQIFRNKGFEGELLEQVVEVITKDRELWIDTMLTDELGLQLEPPHPVRAAVTTMVAFVAAGMVPLLPVMTSVSASARESFPQTAMLTAVTFFAIGVFRGKETQRNVWIAGLETLLIGAAAAVVAYGVGALLERAILR